MRRHFGRVVVLVVVLIIDGTVVTLLPTDSQNATCAVPTPSSRPPPPPTDRRGVGTNDDIRCGHAGGSGDNGDEACRMGGDVSENETSDAGFRRRWFFLAGLWL